jgi:hypothetical protein
MKKTAVVMAVLWCVAAGAGAEMMYFDAGLGAGMAWTDLNGGDAAENLRLVGGDVLGLGFEAGMKMGYGPIDAKSVYIVGELGGISHAMFAVRETMFYNSFFAGAGVVVYPTWIIQLAFGGGAAFDLAVGTVDVVEALDIGAAWNVSCAFDFGGGYSGILLGVKYAGSVIGFKEEGIKQVQNSVSVFMRYAFREKLVWLP